MGVSKYEIPVARDKDRMKRFVCGEKKKKERNYEDTVDIFAIFPRVRFTATQ